MRRPEVRYLTCLSDRTFGETNPHPGLSYKTIEDSWAAWDTDVGRQLRTFYGLRCWLVVDGKIMWVVKKEDTDKVFLENQ